MTAIKKGLATALLLLTVQGCGSFSIFDTGHLKGDYASKKHVNASLEGIIKAFDKVTLGVRGRNANGREIVSRYMMPKGDSTEAASTKKNRAYARLLILGDRRPYDLEMQFVIEEDQGGGDYQVTDMDEERAKKLLKKLIDTLVSRPDTKDFIDDFKAF